MLSSNNASLAAGITAGTTYSSTATVSDLLTAIDTQISGVTATMVAGGKIQLSGPTGTANALTNFSVSTGGSAPTFDADFSSSTFNTTQAAGNAGVPGVMQNLVVNAGGTAHTFQIAAGSTVADVIQTINNAGTGITASQDATTGKLMLTDSQDNGDITVSDNVGGNLVNNLSGETLGGTTNGFTNPELMTSSNTMSIFLSDSTQTGTSTVNVALNTFNSSNMGTAGTGIANNDLTTTTDAATALTAINAAISNVSALRGDLGSGVNQLQAATNVISSQTQNLTTASSNITSADIGQTVANMTEFSILSQTGMAAMAQADQMQKGILTLLQG
jgi:flagellin